MDGGLGAGGGGNGGGVFGGSPLIPPTAATANTGGGGGGGFYSVGDTRDATAGASGLVILRMPTASYTGTTTGSPSVSTDGTDTVLTYTSSGSYTA